jgi:hypothetical protein
MSGPVGWSGRRNSVPKSAGLTRYFKSVLLLLCSFPVDADDARRPDRFASSQSRLSLNITVGESLAGLE